MNSKAKDGRISVVLPIEDKKALDAYCTDMDITVSQFIRRLVRQHFKDYEPTFDE